MLVQTNYGGVLTINGAPVGQELERYYLKDQITRSRISRCQDNPDPAQCADGSVIVVIATDAPVDARNLKRMGARSMLGLARTGAAATNGSGDYAIAFTTAIDGRVKSSTSQTRMALFIEQ